MLLIILGLFIAAGLLFGLVVWLMDVGSRFGYAREKKATEREASRIRREAELAGTADVTPTQLARTLIFLTESAEFRFFPISLSAKVPYEELSAVRDGFRTHAGYKKEWSHSDIHGWTYSTESRCNDRNLLGYGSSENDIIVFATVTTDKEILLMSRLHKHHIASTFRPNEAAKIALKLGAKYGSPTQSGLEHNI